MRYLPPLSYIDWQSMLLVLAGFVAYVFIYKRSKMIAWFIIGTLTCYVLYWTVDWNSVKHASMLQWNLTKVLRQ